MLADSSTSVSLCGPGQHEKQVLVRAVNAEVWLKPQMSPRMWASKEKELKSSLMANSAWSYTSPDKSLSSGLHNISKKTSAPSAELGLAAAAVGLWARSHVGWARPESELSPQLPQWAQAHSHCSPGT